MHGLCTLYAMSILRRLPLLLEAHLKRVGFVGDQSNEDGRINSIQDESTIVQCLEALGAQESFTVHRPPKPRWWYDVAIEADGVWFPINIKVSVGGTDNALNKQAIVYTYSTMQPNDIPKCMTLNAMVKMIGEHGIRERNDAKEYYYLFIHKRTQQVICRPMSCITHFVSNPCNLLQINWKKECAQTECTYRPFEYVKKVLAASVRTYMQSVSLLMEDDDGVLANAMRSLAV